MLPASTLFRAFHAPLRLPHWFFFGTAIVLFQTASAHSALAQTQPRPPLDDDADLVAFQAREAEARRLVREEALAATQRALASVSRPEPRAVAKALGAVFGEDLALDSQRGGTVVSFADLDRDGVPELLYQRPRVRDAAPGEEESGIHLPARALLMLAWDGTVWRATSLVESYGVFEMQVLGGGGLDFAVTVLEGADEIPYPAVFRFRDHAAELVWDSRSVDSPYQGYIFGDVEFVADPAGGAPKLVVTGKADTGAIRFPRLSVRGFLARGIYRWDGSAYVPEKIEFGVNEDFTLHRFLAALRLRDFASAYAAIEPARFLESDEPSLEKFREYITSVYPEFLGGYIFEARDAGEGREEDRAFELERDGKLFVYRPRFDGPPQFRLLGIERREEAVKKVD